MKRLYVDVGVLLSKTANTIALAPHASEFLTFALKRFDCHWCSAPTMLDPQLIVELLRPHLPDPLHERLQAIRHTPASTLKTENMSGDFYWIDDSPLAAEVTDLCRRGALDRWIEVNPRIRPDDLLEAINELTRALARDPSPPRPPANRHPTRFPQWFAHN